MTKENMSFSFKKKGTEIRRISGTKFSHRKSQLFTSTGNMSLDIYLGGGQAVGTVLLLEEDLSSTYSNILLKYYLAEGVMNCHSIFLATANKDGQDILETLPAEFKHSKLARYGWPPPDDELNCAWGYEYARNAGEVLQFNREYDLSSSMSRWQIEHCSVSKCDMFELAEMATDDTSAYIREPYSSVLRRIKDTLHNRKAGNSLEDDRLGTSLLRIVIDPIASPLLHTEEDPLSLLRFLYALRSLLRSAYAVAVVTMPSAFLQDVKLKDKVHQLSDYVARIIPFLDYAENKNPMTKGFHGLFEMVKLSHLNSTCYQNLAADLAFKLYSKTFRIKQLHLPPCVEDAPGDNVSPACGAASKLLEF